MGDSSPPVNAGVPSAGRGRSAARRQVRFGHVWIDVLTLQGALEEIAALVEMGAGGCVFTPNVDHVVVAEEDRLFRDAYQRANLALADGQPIVWTSRLLGARLPARVSGSDLVWPLMELAAKRAWRVFLVGGAPGVAEAAAERLDRELGVRIAGIDASVVPLTVDAGAPDPVAARIASSRPHLVLVALGCPKQERWIHRNLDRIQPAVALGIGASLDFVTGRVRRAPGWVSRAGLEWLYRLGQEPRRLAGRYLLRDPKFLLVLLRTALAPRSERVRDAPPWSPARRAGTPPLTEKGP